MRLRVHAFPQVCCLTALLLLAGTGLQAQMTPMPEFTGVDFDGSMPRPTLAKLKGKAVFVMFFQSWCGICNKWAPDALGQFQKAHGNNKALVLIAIKTDGGGLSGAKSHLKACGADLSLWTVGSDPDAAFYKRLTGRDELWQYALVGPDGNIVAQSSVGSYFTGSMPKRYAISGDRLLADCSGLTTLLPPDKQYAPAVTPLVRIAEMGEPEIALTLCLAAAGQPKSRDAAAELKADLQPIIEQRLSQRAAVLADAAAPSSARYEALVDLIQMSKDLKNYPAATKLSPAINKAKQEPAMQTEARAETAYRSALARLQKASARDKPRIVKELETLALKNPETKYGQLAGARAKELSESVLAHSK